MNFKGYVATRRFGSKCEFDFEVEDEDLKGLEPGSQEYEDIVQEAYMSYMWEELNIGWTNA